MNRFATMEAFVRVVETGSFSSAARQLNIGQPSISKMVAQLEERLGVRLLLRSTHGLTPTEAGISFFERAKRSLEAADEAELAARGAAAGLSGRLRICAATTFARLHLIPRLPEFLAQHPKLDIAVVLDDRNVDLVEAGIDLALRMGTLTESNLTARKIGQSRRLVLGTPSFFAKGGEPAVPADLLAHQAVIYDLRGGGAGWIFKQGVTEASVNIKGRISVTAAEGMREAVFADLGFAIASEWMFSPELANGRVKEVLSDWRLPPLELWAVFPTGRRVGAKARAFATFVEQQFSTSMLPFGRRAPV